MVRITSVETTVMAKTRVGIFGGTFDPFHLSHLNIMCAAKKQADLERIYVAPNYIPPHKTTTTTPHYHRFAMTALAIREYEYAVPILLADSGYACDEIKKVQEMHPDCDLYMIMGQDSFLDLPRWREYQFITNAVSFIVYPRGNPAYLNHSTVQWLAGKTNELSATEVRLRIQNSQQIHGLSTEVCEYVLKTGLYGVAPEKAKSVAL